MKFPIKRSEINDGLLEIITGLTWTPSGLWLRLTKLVTHIVGKTTIDARTMERVVAAKGNRH
jgi:hypothetical protein